MAHQLDAPIPKVKAPRLLGDRGAEKLRAGRGFSPSEVKEVGLSINDARLLGIPVDTRRRSSYEWNVKALRDYLSSIKEGTPAKPAVALEIITKESKGKAFRGLTPAGRRSRGLYSVGLLEVHKHKWSKKQKERDARKRHEAVRRKGGN
ncbi:hypothetical protein GCM10007981_06270 [Thermocladium modestius]|uniref:Large ribosomal subunit protein eL13 n=1 Tax=Thermocladium modestius TaxID=62609 RepID=A0A830GUX5_9CREN|nr:ribosomal protein L13e [Thermocladium modestius]GGP20012.1 hypothetical protein GCM10007981_06270 [Thermocladium modestius]